MTLYEIDQQILDCVDPETGEVADLDALMALQLQRDEKIEGVALWIKDLTAENAAIKAEKATLTERIERNEKTIESLKRFLVQATEGQKFSTAKVVVSFRKSESVEVDEAELHPQFFRTRTTSEPDKVMIKQWLKDGYDVAGAKLITKNNILIK